MITPEVSRYLSGSTNSVQSQGGHVENQGALKRQDRADLGKAVPAVSIPIFEQIKRCVSPTIRRESITPEATESSVTPLSIGERSGAIKSKIQKLESERDLEIKAAHDAIDANANKKLKDFIANDSSLNNLRKEVRVLKRELGVARNKNDDGCVSDLRLRIEEAEKKIVKKCKLAEDCINETAALKKSELSKEVECKYDAKLSQLKNEDSAINAEAERVAKTAEDFFSEFSDIFTNELNDMSKDLTKGFEDLKRELVALKREQVDLRSPVARMGSYVPMVATLGFIAYKAYQAGAQDELKALMEKAKEIFTPDQMNAFIEVVQKHATKEALLDATELMGQLIHDVASKVKPKLEQSKQLIACAGSTLVANAGQVLAKIKPENGFGERSAATAANFCKRFVGILELSKQAVEDKVRKNFLPFSIPFICGAGAGVAAIAMGPSNAMGPSKTRYRSWSPELEVIVKKLIPVQEKRVRFATPLEVDSVD